MKRNLILILLICSIAVIFLTYFLLNNNFNNVYSINGKNFYLYKDNVYGTEEEYRGVKLLEYDNSNNDCATIYYILYDYSTDPSYTYTIRIEDEQNKNLILDKDEDVIIGGMVCNVRIKKVPLNSKIMVSVYEKTNEEVTGNSSIQIDLSKDLEKVKKIDQLQNVKEATIGNVKFKYIDSDNVYFGDINHTYSEKLVGKYCSIPVKVQYGNILVYNEYIDLWCEKNVNNLSCDDAFEKLKLITNSFGQYGLSDIYGLYIPNSEDNLIIKFEDFINLCLGKTIIIDNKEYTKEMFDTFDESVIEKKGDEIIGNGIKAINYIFKNDPDFEYYMFEYKDNIYYIKFSKEIRIKNEVTYFLNNLELT